MAKRRAQDCLLHESPSKRCCAHLSHVDMPLDAAMAATSGGVSPPALLALLGSRCRKRPRSIEEADCQTVTKSSPRGKLTQCGAWEHADVVTVHASGSLQGRPISSSLDSSPLKRPRIEPKSLETYIHVPAYEDTEDKSVEDNAFNSFQYWRVPLPDLDLSLLRDGNEDFQTRETAKLKDSFSDAMET